MPSNNHHREDAYSVNNRKLLLFSFLISLLFWFIVKLSKTYTVETTIFLDYQIPREISINNELPTKVQARIKAKGSQLLFMELGLKSITAKIEIFKFIRLGNDYQTVPVSQLLQEELGGEIQIVETYPALITFDYIKKSSAELPIVSKIKFVPKYGFYKVGNVEFEPPYTTVIADPKLLLIHNQWYTKDTTIEIMHRRQIENVALEQKDNIFIDPQKVKAVIKAKRFCEHEIVKKVEIINAPKQLNIRVAPGYVKVKLLIPVEDLENFPEEKLKVFVDFKKLSPYSNLLHIQTNEDSLNILIKKVFIYPNIADVVIYRKDYL